ncbi:MAG: hypothetical protein ACJ786_25765 [Catenulispora sp.]
MATVDDLWAWISPRLQELAAERAGDRGKPWAELRAGFLGQAGSHPFAEDVIQRLDNLAEDDRSALLDDKDRLDGFGYQIAQQWADPGADPDPGAAAPAAGYDDALWQRYLTENGTRWDGTDAAWPQFMEWFRYYADQAGLGDPASGLLNHLNGQSAPERIATLAQYGVTIAAPDQAIPPAPQAGGSLIMPTAEDIHISLSAEPAFAALPADKQSEVVAQVRAALGG